VPQATRCDCFVLIDEYLEIQEMFMLGAAMATERNRETTDGYHLYKTVE
jgi:hypothetical protein